MNITLGNYSISLKKQGKGSGGESPPPTRGSEIPLMVSLPPGQARSPILYNTYDRPSYNINFIRETVSACMHARSEAISRGRFHAYREHRMAGGALTKQALPAEHPLERLLMQPNPLFDLSDLLELSSQWLDATGNSLWLKVRNGHGEVAELWPISALNFTIERGVDEMPNVYRFLSTGIKIPASDIIHLRRADLRTAPFHGHSILSDILDTAKTDTAVRLFQERFFENDATPRAVLRWPQGALMTQDQMEDVRSRWEAKYGSASNAGKIGILPDGGEVSLLSGGAKELDFINSKKELRNAIREAFKVPQITLGDVEGVNLANAETSYMVFMRDVVDFALAKHARVLTRSLAREWGIDIIIEHDPIVPETEDRIMARMQQLKQAMSADEQRAILNLPPLPDGKGKVFFLGSQVFDANWKVIT